MTPQTWKEIDGIVANALELPEVERAAYLEEACAGKPGLRAEAESLLGMSTGAACLFTGDTAAEHFDAMGEAAMLGRRVGAYVLRERIGHGGMGTVFRAERADDEFLKSVAVKLIAGGTHSSDMLNRFAVERQILATLEHPDIARLLDAGVTSDGLHYIVMEYVEGQPITDYCAARRLPVDEKLGLLRRVSMAVHFAHQHLIVHRDLKPANILVNGEGAPKLLDFGIAKLLSPEAGTHHHTLTAIPMTPDYASPEQARGRPLTTASDVYSLGVILYELLAGKRPYRLEGGALEEVLKAVCEQEPPKPSTIAAESGEKLAPDLDAIVLKAMSKSPEERYASAEQFAADVDRYLAGLPVAARGTRWSYRARKFVLRHKLALASCAVGLGLTLAGAGGILWQARIAEQERALAERRFSDVRDLANSLIFELHDMIKDLPGSTPARKVLVERALHYLDSLSQEAHGDIRLEAELASAYERLGQVEGYPGSANLGDTAGALASLRKALAIRESLATQQPGSFDAQRARGVDVARISECLHFLGRHAEAASLNRRELPITEEYARGRKEAEIQDWLAGAYFSTAVSLVESGDLDEALRYIRRSASIREGISRPDGPLEIRTKLVVCYEWIAYVLSLQREYPMAIETQRKVVTAMEDLAARYPGNATIQVYRAQAHLFLGKFLGRQGRWRESLAAYHEAAQECEALKASDPRNVLTGRSLAETYLGLGGVLTSLGSAAQGEEYLRKALGILDSLPVENPKNVEVLGSYADSYEGLGVASEAMGRRREAITWYRRSQQIWEEVGQQRGSLHPDDVEKPARLRQRIERLRGG